MHGLELEVEVDLTATQGPRTVTAKEVKASIGKTAEGWTRAVDEELIKNFAGSNVFTISTDAEKRAYGLPLPMKLVYVQKSNGKMKVRAVVCGNLEKSDPTQTLWTARQRQHC